jgi:hypothetical protein
MLFGESFTRRSQGWHAEHAGGPDANRQLETSNDRHNQASGRDPVGRFRRTIRLTGRQKTCESDLSQTVMHHVAHADHTVQAGLRRMPMVGLGIQNTEARLSNNKNRYPRGCFCQRVSLRMTLTERMGQVPSFNSPFRTWTSASRPCPHP